MNLFRFCLSLMLCTCFACNVGQKRLPVPEKKLIEILTDAHYAEAALQEVYGNQKDSLKKIYYKEIFQLHKVSKEEMTKSMDILREDPARLDKIYQAILENLKG
jgi:hypothetical protein